MALAECRCTLAEIMAQMHEKPTEPEDPTGPRDLFDRLRDEPPESAQTLIPIVYDHLRQLAEGAFRGRAAQHTLQPTALVHEACLKLMRTQSDWKSRSHFMALAATAMRQVLQDHARAKRTAKRSSGRIEVTLDRFEASSGPRTVDLISLDEALTMLDELNDRYSRLVELRFFGGLTHAEIAHVLEVSPSMIDKDWRFIRAWLKRRLKDSDPT